MSFFTTLHFYRPTKPPVVTGASLAALLRAFNDLGVSDGAATLGFNVKFGDTIDQDDHDTTWDEHLYDGVLYLVREIEWDLSDRRKPLSSVIEALAGYERPIYRASVDLGTATPEIRGRMERLNSPEVKTDLMLTGWSLEIGPIAAALLSSEEGYHVGWISVNLSGYGYLYPWTPRELVERAESEPGIRRVADLCRRTWPVTCVAPDAAAVSIRRQMGDLWPYPSVDLPWDWYWGIDETG